MLLCIQSNYTLAVALVLITEHMESHAHPTCLVPHDVAMQCPDAFIIS